MLFFAAQQKNPQSGSLPEEDPQLDTAVEKELFAAMANKLASLSFVPVLGNIYLVCMLFYTVLLQGFMLLLAGLYGCTAVLGIKGWYSAVDRGLLYVAGGTMFFAYAATAFLSFFKILLCSIIYFKKFHNQYKSYCK